MARVASRATPDRNGRLRGSCGLWGHARGGRARPNGLGEARPGLDSSERPAHPASGDPAPDFVACGSTPVNALSPAMSTAAPCSATLRPFG